MITSELDIVINRHWNELRETGQTVISGNFDEVDKIAKGVMATNLGGHISDMDYIYIHSPKLAFGKRVTISLLDDEGVK